MYYRGGLQFTTYLFRQTGDNRTLPTASYRALPLVAVGAAPAAADSSCNSSSSLQSAFVILLHGSVAVGWTGVSSIMYIVNRREVLGLRESEGVRGRARKHEVFGRR